MSTTDWWFRSTRKYVFLLTSDDVIHSWWVPDLGWKRDAIPGMVNEAWTLIEEEGIYRGQCAELWRQGSRLHADRGRSGLARRVRRLGG